VLDNTANLYDSYVTVVVLDFRVEVLHSICHLAFWINTHVLLTSFVIVMYSARNESLK